MRQMAMQSGHPKLPARRLSVEATVADFGKRLLIRRDIRAVEALRIFSVEVPGDLVERIREIVADGRHRGDDHDGDERGDEAVFDRRSAGIFAGKCFDEVSHGCVLSLQPTIWRAWSFLGFRCCSVN